MSNVALLNMLYASPATTCDPVFWVFIMSRRRASRLTRRKTAQDFRLVGFSTQMAKESSYDDDHPCTAIDAHVHESAPAYSIAQYFDHRSIAQSVLSRCLNSSRHLRSTMVEPSRRNETTSRLLKNSGCRLLKKIQRRGTREIDELRRTYSTLQRGD
jgi:hypothetical protein